VGRKSACGEGGVSGKKEADILGRERRGKEFSFKRGGETHPRRRHANPEA